MARRKTDRADSDKLTAKFTDGQLAIGISVTLFVMLLCLMCGILIGKMQTYDEDPSVSVTGPDQEQPAPEEQVASPGPKGVQTSPRTDALSSEVASPAPKRAAEKTPPKPPAQMGRTEPAKTVLPPLPPTPKTTAEMQESMQTGRAPAAQATAPPVQVVPLPGSAEEKQAASTQPSPAAEKPKEAPETAAPAPKEEKPKETLPAAPPAPKEEKPAAPGKPAEEAAPSKSPAEPAAAEASSSYHGWAIQLVAFTDEARAARATEYRQRLKKNAGYDALEIVSDDGKTYRIVIPYPDKAAAQAAAADLKQKAGFSDAWVREIP